MASVGLRMDTLLLLSAALISTAAGHIQMSDPYPIRSPLNPSLDDGAKDYSYTTPLSASGADFPCKGYAQDPFESVADYSAGGEYALALNGTATHGGGSCQIALSYDRGGSFQVIKSILGNCPMASSYRFRVPGDAPDGPALLAWTWFNKVGYREMYMNCAQVTVHADATAAHDDGRTVPDQPAPMRWADRPTIFVANVDAEGQCTTVENEEVNFPRPGPEAEGALSGPGFRCAGAATFLDGGSDPAPAIASGSTPTPSIGVVPSLAGVSCSLTPSGTAAVTGNVMDPAFGVNIVNNLDSNIHAWSVAQEPGPERLIAARGGSYFEAWRTRDDNGGISIKLALEASQKSILQFEYSLVAALVYWDVSFIDLDRTSDFITHGINMSTSNPQCPGLICRPGDQNCSSVYLEPDDNYAVRGCLRETNLTLSIGSWPE